MGRRKTSAKRPAPPAELRSAIAKGKALRTANGGDLRAAPPWAAPPANRLAQKQADINRSTAGNWAGFAPHRRRVTELIAGRSDGLRRRPGARLAVLGAGNCNDLDLHALAASFAAIDLFDLDGRALAKGIRSQSMQASPRLCAHGGVDFTGILPRLAAQPGAALPQLPDRQTELGELVRLAAVVPSLGNGAGYDVVASTCLLSQMISSAVSALGEAEPLLPALVLAMRKAHFGLLNSLAIPGGTVVFVSDLVASDTCPDLLSHSGGARSENKLGPLMATVVRDGNFFTGLNPYAIVGMLGEAVDDLCLHAPWLWPISSQRTALVYAVTYRRR